MHIFKTEHEGQQALYILFDNGKESAPNIIQSVYNFIQPKTETNIESRLSTPESNIEETKELLFQNLSILTPNHQKKSIEKAEGGIRTRVVASTGRGLFDKCTSNCCSLPDASPSHYLMNSTLLPQGHAPNSNSYFYNNNNLTLLQLEFTQEEFQLVLSHEKFA